MGGIADGISPILLIITGEKKGSQDNVILSRVGIKKPGCTYAIYHLVSRPLPLK